MNTLPRYYFFWRAPAHSHKRDGDPVSCGCDNMEQAIKDADHEAVTYRGHTDFQGGTFEVWDRFTDSMVHQTATI